MCWKLELVNRPWKLQRCIEVVVELTFISMSAELTMWMFANDVKVMPTTGTLIFGFFARYHIRAIHLADINVGTVPLRSDCTDP